MEPISAMDVLMKRNDIQAMKNIQMKLAFPPAVNPIAARRSVFSQVHMSIMEKPKIDKKWKFLWSQIHQPCSLS